MFIFSLFYKTHVAVILHCPVRIHFHFFFLHGRIPTLFKFLHDWKYILTDSDKARKVRVTLTWKIKIEAKSKGGTAYALKKRAEERKNLFFLNPMDTKSLEEYLQLFCGHEGSEREEQDNCTFENLITLFSHWINVP